MKESVPALLCAAALAVVLPAATAAGDPSPSPRLTLPAPTGHHQVGTTTLHLVDTSRPDPWVPTDQARELVIQLWYPASTVEGYPRAPWMTPITARAYEKENGLPVLDWPITDGHVDAPVQRHRDGWPVVLYDPGLGGQRQEETAAVEDLASHGYVVVTIDHVHDSGVVELPDGSVATAAVPDPTLAVTTKEVESRVADIGFVLDQLAALDRGGDPDHEHRPLPRDLRGAFDLDRVGMFGHSDGGSTTAHALHTDPRVTAGVDVDGTLWTPQAVAGSDHPLLLIGRQTLDTFEASTWARFRSNQRGPRLQLSLTGSTHSTFDDLAIMAPQAASFLHISPGQLTAMFGTINGQRAATIMRTYLNAWFDTYLRHHDSHLLGGPSPRFPEIQFVP